ncbi:MAG TPA: hypothetical protein VI488_09445 [Candidatus Angelobacter sp.]
MFLFADRICFPEPCAYVIVNLIRTCNPEEMNVVAWRDGIDAPEARMLKAPRQDYVRVQPLPTRGYLGERHSYLESDPGLLGKDDDRAQRGDERCESLIESADLGRLIAEMVLQVMLPAGMGLVAIGKTPPAARARPEWLRLGHGLERTLY